MPFWLLALLTLVGYAALPFVFPLIPYYRQVPLSDVRTFTPSLLGGLAYALLFLLLYLIYAQAYRELRKKGGSLLIILLPVLLFIVPLLFTYPINATDLFRYFVRARVTTVHGASALAVPPSAFPDDPYLPLAGQWAAQTSPYGPVWELVAAGITLLSRESLLLALLLFKGLGAALHLGGALLIWQMLRGLPTAERAGRTLLWAWNPALLFMFIVDAHNDALMLFWLLLGLWIMRDHARPLIGFWVMALAPLTKLIGLLPLPLFFVEVWRRQQSWGERLRFLLAAGIGSVLLATLAFLPFGSPLDLVLRLLGEASSGGGFSIGVLLLLLGRAAGIPLTEGQVAMVGSLIFILFALWLAWRVWRGRPAVKAAADIFAGYIATAITFRIWYAIWPFPWVLLEPSERPRRLAAIYFLLTTQLSVVLYGHLRAFVLGGSQFAAHLIGVPFVFALPLLLAYAVHNSEHSDAPQK